MSEDDILGYLCCLQYRPVINQLTSSEYNRGHANLMGCLVRLLDYLEKEYVNNSTCRLVHQAILHREHLNGYLPHGDLNLDKATASTATLLYGVLRGGTILPDQVKKDFINKLDLEFKAILNASNNS